MRSTAFSTTRSGNLPARMDFGAALLDAADIAGVVVIDLLLELLAGQHHLGGVDDDDIVAAIHMRRVGSACACRAAAWR